MTSGVRRLSAVAGVFYPNDKLELNKLLELSFRDDKYGPGKIPPATSPKQKIYGLVSPHAGYIYSGSVAANGFYQISSSTFDDVVMIGPNHYGIGTGVATTREGSWETPLGQVEVNSDLALAISRVSSLVDFDDFAHSRDHCLEVQIPFLQFTRKDPFKIVPIIVMMQDKKTASELGKSVAQCTINTDTLLIASSDFTHYEPNAEAHRKDNELIKTILSLDVSAFYSVLERLNVSACGYGAIASVMTAVKILGATKGVLLKYATSGDVKGDTRSVVGYSSIIFQ